MSKFFNQKIKKGRGVPTGTIVVAVIVAILIFIAIAVLISVLSRNSHKDAVIAVRDVLSVEINEKNIDKTLFFTELENVMESDINVDYSNVKFSELGTYEVPITIYKKKYSSKVEIIDTENPVLVTKNVKINAGSSYTASDFVDSCKDNSNKKCEIEFYDLALDQSGEKVDYSGYTEEGTYTVQIIAKDEAGNKTSPKSATLTIGSGVNSQPLDCKYGNSEYDTSKILSVNVTDNGCALDLNLYKNEEKLAPVNALIKSETEKIQKEFGKINLGVKDIYVHSDIATVLNNTGTGVVGYTLKITVSIMNENNEEEVIEDYYVNINGGREYLVNKYL